MKKGENLFIYDDINGLSREAAEVFLSLCTDAVRKRGHFTVALSGGKTPNSFYGFLATDEYRAKIPWGDVHLFWGDERSVPPDHPESNYGSAYLALISRIGIPAENIHRMKGEDAPPEAARAYERELKGFFGEGLPVFDLFLLGLGPDGHTLSLFPDTPALRETERLVVENPGPGGWRITMTTPIVNNASNAIFLVSGGEKASIVKEVLSGRGVYPAELVNPRNGRLLWILDREAAALI